MRVLWIGLISAFISFSALAEPAYEPLLDKVTLQFSAEQWAIAKTALVTVGVNASVSENQLEKIQADVLTKLNQITNKAEWHVTAFNRTLDQSGLERVQISAQIRLAAADLVGLRDKAKGMSKPGMTFTIDNIEFTPSEMEIRDTVTVLRNKIYDQVKNEIANLNKLYPDQKYYLHDLNFVNFILPAQQAPVAMMKVAAAPALTVSDKIQLSAIAVLASAPSQDVVKLVHN